jgi:hypothetical protein
MDFLQKYLYRVFELPLPGNAQKRTKNKSTKNILGLVGCSKVNQTYVGVRNYFGGPLGAKDSCGAPGSSSHGWPLRKVSQSSILQPHLPKSRLESSLMNPPPRQYRKSWLRLHTKTLEQSHYRQQRNQPTLSKLAMQHFSWLAISTSDRLHFSQWHQDLSALTSLFSDSKFRPAGASL